VDSLVSYFVAKRSLFVWLAAAGALGLLAFGLKIATDTNSKTSGKAASAGLVSYKKGKFNEAISDLEKATESDPGDSKAQRTLGQSYEATGKLAKAVRAYQGSLAADPEQPEIHYNLAIIYKSQSKTDEAIQELNKAIKLNKSFVAAKIILGDLYLLKGEKAEAKKQYQAVIDLKPFGVDLEAIKAKLNKL
jgi:tetratricopeptide (TPR) repeat protein